MKRMNRFLVLICSFFFLGILQAQAAEYAFDKAHSSFRFSVKHIYSTIYGYFEDYNGKIIFDPDKLDESKFLFIIDVSSIQTNIAKRDNHLRSDEFFNAKTYPQIIFESSAIKHIDGPNYEVTGTLRIKDVSKEIILPVVYHGSKEHPMEKSKVVAGFDFDTTVNRLDYHVGDGKFYNMGVVGKDVHIFVSLEMLADK